ncbi:NAD-dependent malic enzyme [Lacunisphaera limnophila]|uniref:NAD-dependent malic enzyme n=1 Tax=Lacunisphaera limnophila TaxID=1838286 RepID=A0A1D8ARD7_9BACT|nr:NAD-dependent malic enzyme [Lacunisphaera limnophila]AOS43461.1 NAD-dependent malic enzyme [Lacunisphaera limnophila]
MKNYRHGKRGVDLLHDPLLNKGTAFSDHERTVLGLRGLLPPRIHTQAEQVTRVLGSLRRKTSDLEKYIYLIALQERNEALFYRVVTDHLDEMMPIIYTPTVGQACQRWGHIFRRSRGLYITAADRGRIMTLLRNWPYSDVRMIVATDGERILGLGDLGANGMGIPVGKLSLYTACAGIHPAQCLPIMLDVGTNTQSLLDDPLYIGTPQKRLRGPEYDDLVEELVRAVQQMYPAACFQFEDFGNANAFALLQRYQDRICCFNDDIQGTASVTLAGLYSAARLSGVRLADLRILFYGAGEAGIGIGDLIVEALAAEGVGEAAARRQCWFFDSKGLVVRSRTDLVAHKQRFAHDHAPATDLTAAITELKPHALIGVSGMAGAFTEPAVRAMAALNPRPIIFALSNPTSKSECTAEQAYTWTNGAAIYASGSPFAPVTLDGRTHVPGQGNNAYIFPGVGLGVIASQATRVTDEMFLSAARTLASLATDRDLAQGRVYPELARIREVSSAIALAVAGIAFDRGLTRQMRPADLPALIKAHMYQPDYEEYI